MVDSSSVNSQITDQMTQVLTSTLGQAPAQGFSMLDTVMAETIGMAMHNAVNAQQNAQTTANAAITTTCARLLQAQRIKPKPPTPPPKATPLKPVTPTDPATAKAAVSELLRMQKAAQAKSKSTTEALETIAELAESVGDDLQADQEKPQNQADAAGANHHSDDD